MPLLKTLKALIDNAAAHIAQIRLEQQSSEIAEDWNEYAKLQSKLSHIEEVIDITDDVQIGVLLPSVTHVSNEPLAEGNIEKTLNIITKPRTKMVVHSLHSGSVGIGRTYLF